METKPKYAMQAGGACRLWQSPDGNFKHTFLKLDFDCEPDKYPGVVIVTNEHYENACASIVKNLQRELPALLKQVNGTPVAYWWLETDEKQAQSILASLTEHPVFADNR